MKRVALLALSLLYPSHCMATPTAEFAAKWELLKQNPNHMSAEDFANRPEMKAYMQELGAAANALKKKIDDAKSNGQMPDVCPPKEANLDVGTIMADARQLPTEWQSRPFADCFAQVMKIRYPCPSLTR